MSTPPPPPAGAERACLYDSPPEAWDLGPEPQPKYRRDQVREWVYSKRATSFEEMANVPATLRTHLAARYHLQPLALEKVQGSADTTRKYLWRLLRGDFVESVLIPATVGRDGIRASRWTLCVSSQVGCAYGCKFCASGLDGWKRHLSPGEIIAQVIEAERHAGVRVDNLVFMGMGEPMANFPNVRQAIDALNAPWGLAIGARHITVSTSGLVPQILELARDPRQIRLAISLHAATDEVREKIMPINRKYPLAKLLDACAQYAERKPHALTFEYILIDGINDSLAQAQALARHAQRVDAKVNLIPYNTVEGLSWKRPPEETINAFAREVVRLGGRATVRREKGHDIDAACGQLRLKQIREGA